jgi:trafficking protein particle complex subunit 3
MSSSTPPGGGAQNKAQPSAATGGSASSSSSASAQQQANWLWQRQPKASVELFALTYGALVGELLRDLEKSDLISAELDRMGHSMGLRGMEELLSTQQQQSPDLNAAIAVGNSSFPETAAVLQTALKMFFGVSTDEAHSTQDSYSLLFVDNPFTIFVELPDDYAGLEYCALLTGWCRGCLEVLQMDCACAMKQSVTKGDAVNEISVTLNQVIRDGAGDDYQEE